MWTNRAPIKILALIFGVTGCALADDNNELNDIYRAFFDSPVSTEKIESLYRDDIIHVGRPGTALISGKSTFMEINILPLAEMVNTGQIEFSGKAYIVRRIILDSVANDVGYLWTSIKQGQGDPLEQLQKFSWVFVKEDDKWRVLTDFDATSAPLELLENLQAEIVVD